MAAVAAEVRQNALDSLADLVCGPGVGGATASVRGSWAVRARQLNAGWRTLAALHGLSKLHVCNLQRRLSLVVIRSYVFRLCILRKIFGKYVSKLAGEDKIVVHNHKKTRKET